MADLTIMSSDDEESYANEAFEPDSDTDLPNVRESDIELESDEEVGEKRGGLGMKKSLFTRNHLATRNVNKFYSSSDDEDDVVVSKTIAEINTPSMNLEFMNFMQQDSTVEVASYTARKLEILSLQNQVQNLKKISNAKDVSDSDEDIQEEQKESDEDNENESDDQDAIEDKMETKVANRTQKVKEYQNENEYVNENEKDEKENENESENEYEDEKDEKDEKENENENENENESESESEGEYGYESETENDSDTELKTEAEAQPDQENEYREIEDDLNLESANARCAMNTQNLFKKRFIKTLTVDTNQNHDSSDCDKYYDENCKEISDEEEDEYETETETLRGASSVENVLPTPNEFESDATCENGLDLQIKANDFEHLKNCTEQLEKNLLKHTANNTNKKCVKNFNSDDFVHDNETFGTGSDKNAEKLNSSEPVQRKPGTRILRVSHLNEPKKLENIKESKPTTKNQRIKIVECSKEDELSEEELGDNDDYSDDSMNVNYDDPAIQAKIEQIEQAELLIIAEQLSKSYDRENDEGFEFLDHIRNAKESRKSKRLEAADNSEEYDRQDEQNYNSSSNNNNSKRELCLVKVDRHVRQTCKSNANSSEVKSTVNNQVPSDIDIVNNLERNASLKPSRLPVKIPNYKFPSSIQLTDSEFGADGESYSNCYNDNQPNIYVTSVEMQGEGIINSSLERKVSYDNLGKPKQQSRKSFSFSNERVREIERHNQILLRKILTQKPTYSATVPSKKSSTVQTPTKVSNSAVNRKKQQRQINLDNEVLKRKIQAISGRRPVRK